MIIRDWFSAVIVPAVNAELTFSKLGQLSLDVSRPTFRHSSFQKGRYLSSKRKLHWCFTWLVIRAR